jgi:hypothetical protein
VNIRERIAPYGRVILFKDSAILKRVALLFTRGNAVIESGYSKESGAI